MRFLLIPALLVAGGCTTQTPPGQVSNYGICEYTMGGGNNALVAQAEATRRGLDCTAYYPAIAAQRARESAALENAARYFAPRPAPVSPFPRQTNCTSRAVGNTVQTDCW
jgi:hypothetical protein